MSQNVVIVLVGLKCRCSCEADVWGIALLVPLMPQIRRSERLGESGKDELANRPNAPV